MSSPSSPIEGQRLIVWVKGDEWHMPSGHLGVGREATPQEAESLRSKGWEPVEVMPVEEHEAAMKVPEGDGHRVEIEFDGFGPSIKLLHPEGGCPLPEGVCEECGRDLQDPKSKSCISCDVMVPGWCWVQDWVENDGYELLHGKVTLPIKPEWDGDSARLHVQQPATSTQPNPIGDREQLQELHEDCILAAIGQDRLRAGLEEPGARDIERGEAKECEGKAKAFREVAERTRIRDEQKAGS